MAIFNSYVKLPEGSCIRHYQTDFSLLWLCLGMVWTKGKLRNTMWVLKLWLENCMGGKPWLSHEPILEHTEHHWAIFIDIFSSNESWRRRSIGLGGQYLLCVLMCSEHSWHVSEMIWNAYKMHSWCKISIFLTWDLSVTRNDFLELDPINPNGGVECPVFCTFLSLELIGLPWKVSGQLRDRHFQVSRLGDLLVTLVLVCASLWQGWGSNLANHRSETQIISRCLDFSHCSSSDEDNTLGVLYLKVHDGNMLNWKRLNPTLLGSYHEPFALQDCSSPQMFLS